MRRILMTGGSGFIGGHLLRRLHPRHDVVTLGRHRPSGDHLTDVRWIEQDVRQPLDPDRLPRQIDAVIHLAQSQAYKQFPDRASEIFEVNVQGTQRLIEYACQAGASQFIFASSGGVYRLSHEAIPETGAIDPMSFYLSTKYASEVLLRHYEPFLKISVLRFFFVYGPGQQPGMLIPSLARRVANGERITIEGNPGLRINPIYVEDAARAIEASLEAAAPGIFNVAGDEVVSITGLVGKIASATGREALTEHATAGAEGDLIADTARMKAVLGIQPRMSLREGLRSTLDARSLVTGPC